MEEEGGYLILKVEEDVFLEEHTTPVLQMLLVEVKIRIQVSQVAKYLINHEYNSVIVKDLGIMHMNAEGNNMTRVSKVKTSQAILTLLQEQ